ncbi:MAG: glutaredoxin family protein [Planctomycetota bacterium]
MSLYHMPTCPYCVKVRDVIAELGMTDQIELRDKVANPAFGEELKAATGKTMVPCLRIGDQWMHESGDIISYLRGLKG